MGPGRPGRPPYQRPPLTKELWFGRTALDELPVHPEAYYREQGVELLLRREAVEWARTLVREARPLSGAERAAGVSWSGREVDRGPIP